SALEAQYEEGDSTLAAHKLQSLSEDEELGKQANIARAQNQISSGNYAGAVSTLHGMLSDKESDKELVYYTLVECYLEMGDTSQAKKYAQKLIDEYPDSSKAYEVMQILR
ncbi:MAG: tetratricopeptide repeat protein, partial [Candidatus Muiribacteriota bacterium]